MICTQQCFVVNRKPQQQNSLRLQQLPLDQVFLQRCPLKAADPGSGVLWAGPLRGGLWGLPGLCAHPAAWPRVSLWPAVPAQIARNTGCVCCSMKSSDKNKISCAKRTASSFVLPSLFSAPALCSCAEGTQLRHCLSFARFCCQTALQPCLVPVQTPPPLVNLLTLSSR